jgi:predicted aspartyl protease
MEARWAAFPEKADKEGEKAGLVGLRGLPDQVTERVRPSILHHEDNSVFVPVTVNTHTAAYFFDTGGWISSVSESEAQRIGLRFTDTAGTTTTMTNAAAFRTAVADVLVVGNVRLKNISFAVFPDDGEPWSQLAPGRQGLLGIPIIIAFRTLRWAHDGEMPGVPWKVATLA